MTIFDFDDFSRSLGVSSNPPSDPGLHRTPGGLSGPARRAALSRLSANLSAWDRRRALLASLYGELEELGLVRPPSRLELLAAAAAGDDEAAAAARRLLAKTRLYPG